MFDNINDKELIVKIIDWGMSGKITKDKKKLSLYCGTTPYMVN